MAESKTPADKTPGIPAPAAAADRKADADLDENGDPWRHPPVAPKDEGPLESFGRSISETVTGPLKDAPDKPKA